MDVMTLSPGESLYRLHSEDRAPMFFDNGPHGRYNPRHIVGLGACYFAAEPLGAFVEVFRRKYVIREDLSRRRLTVGVLGRSLKLFDGTARANRFGPLGEWEGSLMAGSHEESQDFASLLTSDADGVAYLVRHDPSAQSLGFAVFGDAGAGETASLFSTWQTTEVPESVVTAACNEYGYQLFDSIPLLD